MTGIECVLLEKDTIIINFTYSLQYRHVDIINLRHSVIKTTVMML